MKGRFVIGQRVMDDRVKHHWKTLNLSKFKSERPLVLIFGGSGTESNRLANGNAKIVQSLLGNFSEDVDILTVNYNDGDKKIGQIVESCTDLVDGIFLPLISKNGKKLDVQTACKNIRRITMFAHCFGDLRANDLLNVLQVEMTGLAYSKEEQKQICRKFS